MKYYAVIDTNVVISSMLKKGSIPNAVVALALSGEIIPLLNNEILAEYEEVLLRNEFGFAVEDVKEFMSKIKHNAIILERSKSEEIMIDEDDVVFYEIALTGRSFCDAYLVTGNIKHFPIKPFVVTPRRMLEIMQENGK